MENKSLKKQEDLEKHLGGCMAGFFNIFDRPHLLSPKRLSSSPSSPLISKDSGNLKQQSVYSTPELRSPALTLPVMEFKQGSRSMWRFSKEAPRLSLDSRAVVDAKGSVKPRQIRAEAERGSPSVIARLMGLEALPTADPQQPLQRSASESRVSREYSFVDSFNFQNPQLRDEKCSAGGEDPAVGSARAQPARAPPLVAVRRKSFFDSGDIFPEPRQCQGVSDLETLKQLLEALRLKGLLHSSNKQQSRIGNRNLVFDNYHESPVKPSGIRSGAGVSPSRRDRGSKVRTSENSVKSPNRRPTLKEQRRRRPEPVRTGIEDECSIEEDVRHKTILALTLNRQGKTLLERCDKLLHSIAEMAAAEAGESQPSPVSVLDASLYHEDSSPSPVMKRTLDFADSEDESWGGSISSSSDSEYVYISDIIRASDCLPQESDIFSLLEKQQYLKGRAAAQERRLIFDAVQEIVGRRRRLPPWMMVGEADDQIQVIWSEFKKIRKKRSSTEEEDLAGRDLSEDRLRDCQVEMSDAVLDIERLVFKDLIGETICHLAALNRSDSLRRRLLF